MNASEQELYQRIERFSIDCGTEALTFAARLARENAWSPVFAARVIDEYKRFVFLAMVAGHPVTPSDQVDQVWHLHLTYTRSYWERLCGEVLQRPLHHGPRQGGPEEASKFEDWYRNTLESYQRLFEKPPPADIWPESSLRFGDDLHSQRINTKRNWLLRRPRFLSAGSVARGSILCFIAIASWIGWQHWRDKLGRSLGSGQARPRRAALPAGLRCKVRCFGQSWRCWCSPPSRFRFRFAAL
jgi:hypothetical protein